MNTQQTPLAPVNAQTQHTPGEWLQRAERDGRTTTHYVKIGAGNCYLTRGVGQTEAEIQANARLIAASPVLLAACRNALGELERQAKTHRETGWSLSAGCCDESARVLRAAIAHTEGRT